MFAGIVEQSHITGILQNALLTDQVSHAYLFTGPGGIGKKTIANAFATALRCTASAEERPCGECRACKMMTGGDSIDVLTIVPEAGSRTIKIKQIRELIGRISEKTYDGNIRVCFIIGAEQMTTEAQNALLKSLEEPAEKNVFLLTSENPEKLLPTIRSRCQVMNLKPLSNAGMAVVLKDVEDATLKARLIDEARGIPGIALERLKENETTAVKEGAFSKLVWILEGDPMPIFELSEHLGKNKKDAVLVLSDWICGFESLLRAEKTGIRPVSQNWIRLLSLIHAGDAERILDILFTLSHRLDSNVNARLQWEAALLKIYRK